MPGLLIESGETNMSPEDMKKLLLTQPFQPFRLCMTDGRTYKVRHPDAIRVGFRTAVVFVKKTDESAFFYDNFDIISLLHIVRAELVQPVAQATNGD